MNAKLKIVMRKAEGALLRLLGQIGRRGYDVLRVNADLTPDRKAWHVIVEFEPIMPAPPAPQQPRPAEVLPALVAKLVDVVSVELTLPGGVKPAAAEPPKAAAPAKKGEMEWQE
jgi:acetolactate synthase regulatory subunit